MGVLAFDEADVADPSQPHGSRLFRLRDPDHPGRLGRRLPGSLRVRVGVSRSRVGNHVPARGCVRDSLHAVPTQHDLARHHSVPHPRLRRHAHDRNLAGRGRRRGRCPRNRVEAGRGPDRPGPRVSSSIRAGGSPTIGSGRRGHESVRRQISPATSFARSRYSCSFIAAGFAEIRRYESFSVIFSFTFWRNRMIEANPFWEIMYSRPSNRTAAFPPSSAKSEIADAMSTRAPGSATAIPFAFPEDFESQMKPASSMGYRERRSSGWVRVMQSPRAFMSSKSQNSENTRSAL